MINDAVIIGAGQAGPPLARHMAGTSMGVAIVERGWFGGTCVNTGCTPTKTLVASAYAVHLARRSANFGFTADDGRASPSAPMENACALTDNVATFS